jgi:hypothetical protein
MAFSNTTNREIYDFILPDEKPVEVPNQCRILTSAAIFRGRR